MRKHNRRKATAVSSEIESLREIKAQLDRIEDSIDRSQKNAIKSGAIAGGLTGSLSGGLIAIGIEFIKAKLEF